MRRTRGRHLHSADDAEPSDGKLQGPALWLLRQIRDVIEEELEATLAGQKTAKAALDAAQERGNTLLRAFEKANQ